MYITYGVYFVLFILIIWGAKFAGFGKKFNDDFLDKNSTKALSGLAVILVILHHISQKAPFQDMTKELFVFNDMGYMIVTIFLFCSGYGLTINAKNNPNYIKTFAKRRLPIILVPFFVNNIVFAIRGIINGLPTIRIVLGLFGLVQINDNGWYPIVLFILYLIFMLCTKHIGKPIVRIVVYFVCVILMISIFCVNGHFAWWAGNEGWWLDDIGWSQAKWWMLDKTLWFNGEWWVNSAIGFVIGVVFGEYKNEIVSFFKKGYWIKLIVCIGLFVFALTRFNEYRNMGGGYWTEYAGYNPGIKDKFIASAYQMPVSIFFILSLVVLMMKFKSENVVTRFLSTISYETYLYGILPLELFGFLIFEKIGNNDVPVAKEGKMAIYTVAVVLSSILLGFIFNKIDGLIVKAINKNSKS